MTCGTTYPNKITISGIKNAKMKPVNEIIIIVASVVIKNRKPKMET